MEKKELMDLFESYIKNSATKNDIELLCQYLKSDKDLGIWMENEILQSSGNMNYDTKARIFDAIKENIAKERPDKKGTTRIKKHSFLHIYRYAAVFALTIILGISLYYNLRSEKVDELTIMTQPGEKASTILSDNTKVDINSDSKIIYYSDYNKKKRIISLDGEAYFDVTHDKYKPFIVKCSDIEITVLGTSFGIQSYNDKEDISVILHTGRIKMSTPKEIFFLSPNEMATYNKGNKSVTIEKVDASEYNNWRRRRLHFENKSMAYIANILKHTHNIDIQFNDSRIKEERFTGTLDNRNIETVMNMIAMTSNIRYKVKDGVIILYKK